MKNKPKITMPDQVYYDYHVYTVVMSEMELPTLPQVRWSSMKPSELTKYIESWMTRRASQVEKHGNELAEQQRTFKSHWLS